MLGLSTRVRAATTKGGIIKMVAGHLREKNGIFQVILNWKDANGNRKTKSISTGLPVKGNKKRAEAMLMKIRSEFDPGNLIDNADMPFVKFLQKWLADKASVMSAEQYASHAYTIKTIITPYFDEHPVNLPKLSPADLSAFYENERDKNKRSVKGLQQTHGTITAALAYAVELNWLPENLAERVDPCAKDAEVLFTAFMEDWVNMMRTAVKITTYSGYEKNVKGKIIPYFDQHYPGLRLVDLTAKHIQDYYTYEMQENKLTANSVKHRHANIHKALKYAFKTDLITTNPADKVELPKMEKYVGNYYNAAQLDQMFEAFKGDPAEFGVIAASFYGLRRSEIIGLKWDAVDFDRKTITIRHTVTETTIDGKVQRIHTDSTKTKSSYRTLPLVEPFEKILLRMKAEQELNQELCGNCYCQDYLGYIYVNEIGELIKPGYLTAHFPMVLAKHNMPRIRFHDLRHSCASLLFAQGISLKEIQAWLGHSTIGTTANIYTHLDENSKINSANAIVSILPH